MSNFFRSKSPRRRGVFLTLVAGVGICLSLLGYWALRAKEERLLGTRLEADAEQRARAIESRFRADLTAIWGLSSFIRQGQPGSRDEFREVAGRVLTGNRNIHAAYWIPHVEPDERELYELAAVSEGLTAYETLELDPDGRLRPALPNTASLAAGLFRRADGPAVCRAGAGLAKRPSAAGDDRPGNDHRPPRGHGRLALGG